MNKPNWFRRRKIAIEQGVPLAQWENLGNVEHTVIRFKDYYLSVMERDGEIVSQAWSKDPHMFQDVNINDFWSAEAPSKGE